MHIGERCNPGVTEVTVAAQLQGLQALVLCELYQGCICHRRAAKCPQLLKSPQLNNYVHRAVLQVQKGLLSEWPQNTESHEQAPQSKLSSEHHSTKFIAQHTKGVTR